MNPVVGEIHLLPSRAALRGWVLYQGQLLPINQNQALFSLLGTTYGSNGRSTFARPTLPDLCLRWDEPAEALARLVRAANPWNRGALATLRGQPLRVLSATARPETVAAPPGTVVLAAPTQALLVACGAGQVVQLDVVALDEGYFTGGQLAGMGVQVGEVLGTLLAAPA